MQTRRVLAIIGGAVLLALSLPLWYWLLLSGLAIVLSLPGGAFGEPVAFAAYVLIFWGVPAAITFGITWAGLTLVFGRGWRTALRRRRQQPAA